MDTSKFSGTGVALVTPFLSDGSIDYDRFSNIIEFVIDSGVDYLVPLGSTGEATTISSLEQKEVLRFVTSQNAGRLPVVAGCFGGNNTKELISKIEEFDLTKIDALLSSSPHYNKPSQVGIFEHYSAIANSTTLPIILYNVPSRTSSNVLADTVISLSEKYENIIGIKEASGDLDQIKTIIENSKESFLVLSGDDPTARETCLAGGNGVISVIANAYPKSFSTMIKCALNKEVDKAKHIDSTLFPLHKWLYIDGNPSGIKAALRAKGMIEDRLRLPLVPMSASNRAILEKTMLEINLDN